MSESGPRVSLVTLFLSFGAIAAGAVSGQAPIPGGPQQQVECSFECWRHGYVISAIRVGPPGSHEYVVDVDKTDRRLYANDKRTLSLLGIDGFSEWAEQNRVQRLSRKNTLVEAYNNNWCGWDRIPVAPEVNLVKLPNPAKFKDGSFRSGQINCFDIDMNWLVTIYNSNIRNPLEHLPLCGKEGCLTKDELQVDGPERKSRGHCFVPAEFEHADEVPDDYFDGTPLEKWWENCRKKGGQDSSEFEMVERRQGEVIPRDMELNLALAPLSPVCEGAWTGWLNRDGPGGSGDYETLKDHQGAGKVCAVPTAIECQTTDGFAWNETGEEYRCQLDLGGVCLNREQKRSARCSDYKVRFCCG